jgi:hypothetical protein
MLVSSGPEGYLDSYNSWNSLSSLGSGITILSMYIFLFLETSIHSNP